MSSITLTFKASAEVSARLDELAANRGGNRSAAVRAAIVEASLPPGASAIPDGQEVLELLGEAARFGSVPAMRELRVYHRDGRAA